MGALFFAALNRLVRDEPRVAATANTRCRGTPSSDVRAILITNADGLSVERCPSAAREVEDELVAVVQKPPAVNRLVMTHRQIVLESRPRAGQRLLDRNRFDPVNGVLQVQEGPDGLSDIEPRPRIGGLGADIEEQ